MNRTWLAVSESQKSTLKNELQTEVTIQHPLFGWQLDPIGEENKLVVVHLTWSGPGDHQFPSTEFFATWSEFADKKMAIDNLGY